MHLRCLIKQYRNLHKKYMKLTDKATYLVLQLFFFIFGKIGDNEYPNTEQILPTSMKIIEEFSSFINFLREEWFN